MSRPIRRAGSHRSGWILALAAGTALATAAAAPAPPKQSGSLDTSFGGNGTVQYAFVPGSIPAVSTAFETQAVALQSDGKIVVAGSGSLGRTAVMRFTASGAVDTSFGKDGQVHDQMGGHVGNALSAVVQPDGKILVAGFVVAGFVESDGFGSADFALVRYNKDGSPDPEFGTKGYVRTDFGGSQDVAFAMALQPDGRIVVAGQCLVQNIAVARYMPDGTLDPSFGAGGKAWTNLHGGTELATAVALQGDGKIVLAGSAWQKSSGFDFAVVRYRPDGRLDTSFGTGGSATFDFDGQEDLAHAIAVQPDGDIVVAGGNRGPETRANFELVRLHADGSLDSTFGELGRISTDFEGRRDEAHALLLQRDGKIVVAGESGRKLPATGVDFSLARYLKDGRLDREFGDGGKVLTDIGGRLSLDAVAALALQEDGRLLAVGRTVIPKGAGEGPHLHTFALARYLP